MRLSHKNLMAPAVFIFACLAFVTSACGRIDVDAVFERHLWQDRIIVVLTPEYDDPDYTRQIAILEADPDGLAERDIVQWIVIDREAVLLDGEIMPHLGTPPFYRDLASPEREFTVLLIGKDGEEKLRSDAPITLERFYTMIDAMPMRRREVEQ